MEKVLDARLTVTGSVSWARRGMVGRMLTFPAFYMPGTVLHVLQPLFAFNFHSIDAWLRPDCGLKPVGFKSYSITCLAIEMLGSTLIIQGPNVLIYHMEIITAF